MIWVLIANCIYIFVEIWAEACRGFVQNNLVNEFHLQWFLWVESVHRTCVEFSFVVKIITVCWDNTGWNQGAFLAGSGNFWPTVRYGWFLCRISSDWFTNPLFGSQISFCENDTVFYSISVFPCGLKESNYLSSVQCVVICLCIVFLYLL